MESFDIAAIKDKEVHHLFVAELIDFIGVMCNEVSVSLSYPGIH